ncbi:DUF1648 domain-containing protein [Alkalihalobacillus macyae]|uniref:DUF1648 domain-containing protein n=1 Tax=Guptibacillus hwajinpoensis TaxID=208199 RepID=UPI00273B7564|nr:DUF1648 domain-containing protein [Alkalihalobacillus macyae]MDP4549503.1 DUF1648 domain-containing protein [Alkalihalobacillus macyae]
MANRPKVITEKTIVQKIFDVASLLFLLSSFGYVLVNWSILPEQVPIHFNAVGDPNNWGPNSMLIVLPFIGTVLWIGLSILERYPHVYNYIVKITEANAAFQYRNAVALIHFLKNTIAILFAFLTRECFLIGSGEQEALSTGLMPLFLILLFGAVGLYIIQSIRWR